MMIPQGLSPPLAEWLEQFRRERGRAPRLLHIGNVANNGYNNAKLLNRIGLESDVICPDYYHIMGCPEWEDADYQGDIRSDFYPTWDGVDLRGFERPRWFAQGPLINCLHYLLARREGLESDAKTNWDLLARNRETVSAELRGEVSKPSRSSRAAKIARKVLLKGWKIPYIAARRSKRVRWLLMPSDFRKAALRACANFGQSFPNRADRMRATELETFSYAFALWKKLLGHYDLAVGYATYGAFPMLAGAPYIAYEHGTIRNIPFEPTAEGRMCALTYRVADAAFVTNCDNNIAAEKLGISNYKWVPHPINEDDHPTTEPARVHREVREKLDSDFIVFHPSRHHWDARRDTNWDKGNDILITGFAKFVREVNPRAGAVFVEWGQTLRQSKDMIAKHGIERNILWIQPQPTPRMNAYIQAADVLADQFCIGTFGGIMPKGLLFGTPNMIYLEEQMHRWCLPEMPPVLNTRTPDEVLAGLKRLYQDRDFARRLADDGREWYAKYHSSRVVADAFTGTVRDAVSRPRKER